MDNFEWDTCKESQNVRKHGIDFTIASLIWDGPVYERIDDRREYGEIRILTFGLVNGRVLAVLYTPRGERRRIISARRANVRERDAYAAEIARRAQSPPN